MSETSYKDFYGCWLRNARAELFVACAPWPRLLAFRFLDCATPWFSAPGARHAGLRTWFMEPGQTGVSQRPAEQPASLQKISAQSARIVCEVDPETKLRLQLDVSLDPEQATLQICHQLENHALITRTLAAWSILAIPRLGCAHIALGKPPGRADNVILWPPLQREHNALQSHNGKLAVSLDLPDRAMRPFKLGAVSADGQIEWRFPSGLLRTIVPRIALAHYPEGGGDCTLYAGEIAELEHVGPLTAVDPGDAVRLEQNIHLET